MKGNPQSYNTNTTKKPISGGGSSKQSQRNPNGDMKMPGVKIDKHTAYKGNGGAKNGVIKGV